MHEKVDKCKQVIVGKPGTESATALGIPERKLDIRIKVKVKMEWDGRVWIRLIWIRRGINGGCY
jgi:hypothetical protein